MGRPGVKGVDTLLSGKEERDVGTRSSGVDTFVEVRDTGRESPGSETRDTSEVQGGGGSSPTSHSPPSRGTRTVTLYDEDGTLVHSVYGV